MQSFYTFWLILRQGLLVDLECPRLASLTGQQALETLLSRLVIARTGITGAQSTQLFTWGQSTNASLLLKHFTYRDIVLNYPFSFQKENCQGVDFVW